MQAAHCEAGGRKALIILHKNVGEAGGGEAGGVKNLGKEATGIAEAGRGDE
jgi:hypothetical protein